MINIVIDGYEYNFEPTHDPNIAKNYEGFISPDGEFYMVSAKYVHKPLHYEWAEEYLKSLRKNTSDKKEASKMLEDEILLGSAQKYLINIMGFVYYSHSTEEKKAKRPIIIYPQKVLFRPKIKITDAQKEMLYMIMLANHEEEWIPYDIEQKEANDAHERYVDKYIEKQVEEGRKNDKL